MRTTVFTTRGKWMYTFFHFLNTLLLIVLVSQISCQTFISSVFSGSENRLANYKLIGFAYPIGTQPSSNIRNSIKLSNLNFTNRQFLTFDEVNKIIGPERLDGDKKTKIGLKPAKNDDYVDNFGLVKSLIKPGGYEVSDPRLLNFNKRHLDIVKKITPPDIQMFEKLVKSDWKELDLTKIALNSYLQESLAWWMYINDFIITFEVQSLKIKVHNLWSFEDARIGSEPVLVKLPTIKELWLYDSPGNVMNPAKIFPNVETLGVDGDLSIRGQANIKTIELVGKNSSLGFTSYSSIPKTLTKVRLGYKSKANLYIDTRRIKQSEALDTPINIVIEKQADESESFRFFLEDSALNIGGLIVDRVIYRSKSEKKIKKADDFLMLPDIKAANVLSKLPEILIVKEDFNNPELVYIYKNLNDSEKKVPQIKDKNQAHKLQTESVTKFNWAQIFNSSALALVLATRGYIAHYRIDSKNETIKQKNLER